MSEPACGKMRILLGFSSLLVTWSSSHEFLIDFHVLVNRSRGVSENVAKSIVVKSSALCSYYVQHVINVAGLVEEISAKKKAW